jgi:hypothetical protein
MMTADIADRIRVIRALPEFAIRNWWLTFYLTGSKASLALMADQLTAIDAVNLDGADGGFLYPKLSVPSNSEAVIALVGRVQKLAAAFEVEILNVDVDTAADVRCSRFQELIRF